MTVLVEEVMVLGLSSSRDSSDGFLKKLNWVGFISN